ncbi:hypothetical protein H634G_08904 [Metarhizium anisopliae BRIP 53293]|uniref:AB hydrolase-1 domain-containing protein n=1 Tax=Metarhizium anisopliae BRIP 53293 TaxID=1291518 RepID=A0A0D9NSF6_METAN|nr:hypothetical protein H634G_08904 [Metarhizium anisopliae BRIP 53293]KJK95436.1 hypothetical protein H633G_00727 [Metarhizium anisopliae BRIP 53284]
MGTEGSLVHLSDGARLYVKILGDNDRSKQLVVALHGGPGVSDHRETEASFQFLSSRFRVLVYDARGSGRSDPKGPYTHDRWAADIDELRIWAGSEPIILAGGSYGGYVALEYAIKYPSHVSALILRDTSTFGLKSTMYCLKSSLTSPGMKVDADRQYRTWAGCLRNNDDLQASFNEVLPIFASERTGSEPAPIASDSGQLRLHYETHNFAMSYNMPRFDVRPRLGDISAPTLIVVGRHDLVAPVQFSEEMHNLMPNSQLAVFEKSGHNPTAEEPDAFQHRVTQFLDHFRL